MCCTGFAGLISHFAQIAVGHIVNRLLRAPVSCSLPAPLLKLVSMALHLLPTDWFSSAVVIQSLFTLSGCAFCRLPFLMWRGHAKQRKNCFWGLVHTKRCFFCSYCAVSGSQWTVLIVVASQCLALFTPTCLVLTAELCSYHTKLCSCVWLTLKDLVHSELFCLFGSPSSVLFALSYVAVCVLLSLLSLVAMFTRSSVLFVFGSH